MDSADIEKQGLQPLQPELVQIENITTVSELLRITAKLQRKGIGAMMNGSVDQDEKSSDQMAIHIWQGGLGMPNREYYFNTDEKTVSVRKAYRLYLYQSFRSLGKDSLAASKAANDVFQLEIRLARVSRKLQDLRDPNANYYKMNVALVQKNYFNIRWADFLKEWGIPVVDSVIVGQPEFLAELNKEIKTTPLPVWKNYLSFQLLNGSAAYLNQAVFNDKFNYTRSLSGVSIPKPRWKRVLDAEEGAMGEALGQLFVKGYFPEKSKRRYIDMVEAIRDAYKNRIMHLSWMSDSTKKTGFV